ncbi:MAG: DMT family transporter [Clostridia bacterium]|nr:DMT family transporter [Clostridia bacterium]
MKNKKMLGNGLLLLTALIWGTAFVFQRVGMGTISPITFNAARMAVSAAVLAPVALILRRRDKTSAKRTAEEQKRRDLNTLAGGLLCGCFTAVASIFQQIGLVYTSAGKAGFITAMYILLVPVIGFIFLKKKNTWLAWVAVLLGVLGMYLLSVSEGFKIAPGDALVLLCAFFYSFQILSCDRFAGDADPVGMSAIQFAVATAVSVTVAFVAEKPSAAQIAAAWLPIVYCGLLSGCLGYTLQIVGQKFTDPTSASLLMSLESVFAVVAGAIFIGERMTPREIVGCAVMFAAVILVQTPLPKRKKHGEDGDGQKE